MMDKMKKMLTECLETYEKALNQLKNRKTKAYAETLVICGRNRYVEYYVNKKNTKNRQFERTYLRKDQIDLARGIAQGDYEKKLKMKLGEYIRLIRALNDHYPDNGIEDVYLSMNPKRRALVDPVIPIRKERLKEWMEVSSPKMGFFQEEAMFLTENQEQVRSKSEMIIANLLKKEKIPYQYERRLVLNNGREVYPDFSFYDPDQGEAIYWEHFGMMDNSEYQGATLRKINEYAANGIVAGVNLITSFENREVPLNIPFIKKIIDRKLGHMKGWGPGIGQVTRKSPRRRGDLG